VKVYIKKKEALALIPTLKWRVKGTLTKERAVSSDVVLGRAKGNPSLNQKAWRCYLSNGRYFVAATDDWDRFYESEVVE
jgi:hypothetical protein